VPSSRIQRDSPPSVAPLRIFVQAGQNLTPASPPNSGHVAITNASLPNPLFPIQDPVGHRIGNPDPTNPGWLEIVGVVPDVERAVGAVPSASRFLILRPLAQDPWTYFTVAIRSANPTTLVKPMRETIASLDP